MLVPTKDRVAVFQYLFREGVIVAKNDTQLKSHPDLADVRNLYVIKLMDGFVVNGYVRKTYAWQHHYYYITNEGIEYLRDYLHLPASIVPATLKRSARFARSEQVRDDRPSRGRGRGRGRGFGRGGRGAPRGGDRGGGSYRS
uniref:Plectin/eS10 N-terminal domain-containing protein n=1 Tax=Percolomonas cosmopolitus TaxID=63605 RepID=A0A7S1KQB2_9EUKA